MKNLLRFTLVLFCGIFLLSCATMIGNPIKRAGFVPKEPSPEMFAKIKKDVVDATLKLGTKLGYVPLNYDYEKGSVSLEKPYLDIRWKVDVTTMVTIYSPGAGKYPTGTGPDLDTFHKTLMNLYSTQQ